GPGTRRSRRELRHLANTTPFDRVAHDLLPLNGGMTRVGVRSCAADSYVRMLRSTSGADSVLVAIAGGAEELTPVAQCCPLSSGCASVSVPVVTIEPGPRRNGSSGGFSASIRTRCP